VQTIEDTLDKIISEYSSVSRFGDGELDIIFGGKAVFQKPNSDLGNRLKEVLKSSINGHIVCIADYSPEGIKLLKPRVRRNWKIFLVFNLIKWKEVLDSRRVYYNAYISRPYRDLVGLLLAEKRIQRLRSLWSSRDIILVEGEYSRIGVGTDLFDNARTIKRILCPTSNAFDIYDKILMEVIKSDKSNLILIALGPTATVMAFDLFQCGFQAIDLGHIGSEYFSYLKEIKGVDFQKAYGATKNFEMVDNKYKSEILINCNEIPL
jgi:glycosyltransferase family protein